MDMLLSPDFWLAVGQIILIDILLGGDNAVVIALACRKLPAAQRRQGILWGTAGAIALRIVLIFFALQLLAIPLLKVVGAVLLVWIGVKLLLPEHDGEHSGIEGSDRLWSAVKTVIVADFVMSVDNVIAIAGAAEASGKGHGMVLVVFGVLVSIPIIVWGSQMVIKLMDRFPIIITLGGMLLGWIAGTMAVTDPAVVNPAVLPQLPKFVVGDVERYAAGVAGALLVLALGKWLERRRPSAAPARAGTAPSAGPLRRILVAVDGSPASERAVSQVVALRRDFSDPGAVQVHLVNVQPALSSDVSTFIDHGTLKDYHGEHADRELASAQALLTQAALPFETHRKVGSPATQIAETAHALGCDLIVMGTRGQGAAGSVLIGSVAQGVIAASPVPVLMVK